MKNKPRTVGLYTLGCKVAQYETEAIGEALETRGFTVVPFEETADAYVINTCTVTAESDRKSRQMIRRATAKNPNAVVAVCGCYSQTSPREVAEIPGVCIVVGNDKKLALVDLIEEKLVSQTNTQTVAVSPLDGKPFEDMTVKKAPRTRAYVKIEDGCECRCTYCEIPNARGPVRSKAPKDVIAEVEGLYRNGTKEIVLTGIETASYGTDFDNHYRLIDLLEELDARKSCERIRMGSLSPEVMKPDFIDRLSRLTLPVPHFHLSMQSGADAVLRGMKRRYNREMALDALARVRAKIPGVEFTTDMMVGFPGETDDDFLETLDFVEKAQFLDMHVFAYSRRPGTPAADFDNQVPEAVKHERSAILIRKKNEIRDRILDKTVAAKKPLFVILETYENGAYTAHADTFMEVSVKAAPGLHGKMAEVLPQSHHDGVIYAVPVSTL